MCNVHYHQRGSWLPAIVMLGIFWVIFTSFGWWSLFIAFWLLPMIGSHALREPYEQNGDVIVVNKRKNEDKHKHKYDSDDARYIHTKDSDWIEMV